MTLIFGKRSPYLKFQNNSHFFEALGFLVQSATNGACRFVIEDNQEQGAWGQEYRIQIFNNRSLFDDFFIDKVTKGIGLCIGRINNNQYLEHIINNHNVQIPNVNVQNVRVTIPTQYKIDFDRGVSVAETA